MDVDSMRMWVVLVIAAALNGAVVYFLWRVFKSEQ